MKKELVDLQPKLEQAKIDNNKMMKVNKLHLHPAPSLTLIVYGMQIYNNILYILFIVKCSDFQVIEVESVEVEAKSKVVRVDEEAATIKANEAQALKNECESDLAEAIPALEAALSALNTLKVSTLLPQGPAVPGLATQTDAVETVE